jgi:hypothetical protein
MKLSALLLALLVGTPAQADLSADYARAVATFGNPTVYGTEGELLMTRDMLSGLEGRWVAVSGADTGAGELNMEDFPKLCEKMVNDLQLTGQYSFDLIRETSEGPVAFRHRYAGSGQFVRFVDETAYFRWLGLTDERSRSMPALLSLSTQSVMVRLFLISPDLFVLMPERGRQEYWARCPAG